MTRLVVLLLTVILLSGCGGARVTPQAPSEPEPVTMDAQLAEVGRDVPPEGADGRTVVVKTGNYSMEHLSAWYAKLQLQAFSLGAFWTDLDEARNRIALGVKTREAKARIEAEIARLNIPREAVHIETPEHLLSEENPLEGCLLEEMPPESAPDLLLSKTEVKPGEQITLTLPVNDGVTRGAYADLECWNGSEWMPLFTLYHGSGQPMAYLYGGMRDAVGFAGPGPEPVLIPSQLKPGWYRIRKDAYLHPDGSQTFFGFVKVQRADNAW